MVRFFRNVRSRRDARGAYWLAGQFDARPHPADRAIEAWSEILGREGAELWLAAQRQAARRPVI